jgi:hypothetical protein
MACHRVRGRGSSRRADAVLRAPASLGGRENLGSGVTCSAVVGHAKCCMHRHASWVATLCVEHYCALLSALSMEAERLCALSGASWCGCAYALVSYPLLFFPTLSPLIPLPARRHDVHVGGIPCCFPWRLLSGCSR